jgi:hypothetical protein
MDDLPSDQALLGGYMPTVSATRNRLADLMTSIGQGAGKAVDWLAGGAQAGAEPTLALMQPGAADQPFWPTADSGGRIGAVSSALTSVLNPVHAPAGALGAGPVMRTANAALDMSPEARAARAAEMGFDTTQPLYHGTGKDFTAFDNAKIQRAGFGYGHHVAESPILASKYAEQYPTGQHVMPLYMRKGKVAGPDVYGAVSRQVEDELGYPVEREISKRLMGMGYDTIEYKHGRWANMPEGTDTAYVALKPENLRSTNAAFDPARSGESDLLASRAGVPAVPQQQPQPEDPATAAARSAWIQQHLARGGT